MIRFQSVFPAFNQCSRNSVRSFANQKAEDIQEIAQIKGLAYNEVERKKGLFKPEHTLEEQVNYMKSQGMIFYCFCDTVYSIPTLRAYSQRSQITIAMIENVPPYLSYRF